MEGIIDIGVVLSFLSFILFVYIVIKLLISGNTQNAIPGPNKLPLIGNLLLLAGKSPPHHVFRDLAAKYGPLMQLQLGQVPFLIVSSTEVAKQVLRTHDVTFANRIPMLTGTTLSYDYRDIAVAPYGEHWRQLRRICTLELLSSRRVRSFRLIREEENHNLARSIASGAGTPTNLSVGLHLSTFNIIARSSVGNTAQGRSAMFNSAAQEIFNLSSGLSAGDLFPSYRLLPYITGTHSKIAKVFKVTDEILQSIIDQHRTKAAANDHDQIETSNNVETTEDLVDILLKYQQHDDEPHHDHDHKQVHITDDTTKAVILDMLLGGGDTSATAVAWAMSEMMRNPETLRRAQEEVREVLDGKGCVDEDMFDQMKYLKLIIKETLRLHPPLPFLIPRMSSGRCELNGYQVPPKTNLIINMWALGRDPRHWSDPEKFVPERFEESSIDFKGNDFEYMPFGSGRRICPGMSMGLANVEFTLATLLYHFDWEMPFGVKNEELDMTEAFGAVVQRKHDLLLIPTVVRPLL